MPPTPPDRRHGSDLVADDPLRVLAEVGDLVLERVGGWEWTGPTSGRKMRADAPEGAFDGFLMALADGHTPRNACKLNKIAYRLVQRRRESDAHFRAQWEIAHEMSTQVLEQEAIRRALAGSDQLLMFMLRARAPDRYRERYVGPETSGPSADMQQIAAMRAAFAAAPDAMAEAAKQIAAAMRGETREVITIEAGEPEDAATD